MQASTWAESDFRREVQRVFDRIVSAFDDVDPDLAEADSALGSVTITFGDQSRCILSVQPSVRQIWLALASLGTAHHFSYDHSRGVWLDDKDPSIELLARIEKFLLEKAKLTVLLRKSADGK